MSFQMIRLELPHKKEPDQTDWQNPGLFFDKGFQEWKIDSGKRGEDIGKHIKAICEISVSDVYKAAYKRWLNATTDKENFAHWFGKLDGTRLFIGLGMDHVLEAQVCRHTIYGMPYIPGSALKGLARAEARRYAKKQEEEESKKTNKVIDILFGPDCNDSDDPEAEANTGYLIFHDAWWIPGGKAGGCQQKPYAPEIVTVHAVEYYTNQGKQEAPHPDMESPNPNHQIAVQGSFYFVVEGVQQWAELGMKFLTLGLQEEGVGGKISAGYGYFSDDEKALNAAKKMNMSPEEKIKATIDDWGIEKIPKKFGRDYKKTMIILHSDFGDIVGSIVLKHLWKTYGNVISSWENEGKKTAKGKAFKNLTRDKNTI